MIDKSKKEITDLAKASDWIQIPELEEQKPFECPDCKKLFKNVSSLLQHAAMVHYLVQLTKRFKNQFVSSGGKCLRCPLLPRQKLLLSYLKHMGVVHRMMFGLMLRRSPQPERQPTREENYQKTSRSQKNQKSCPRKSDNISENCSE